MSKPHESPAGREVRNAHDHNKWEGGLRYHYNAYDPEDQDCLWCPILKEYALSDERTAAHIVPCSIGYTNAGYLFGERDRGAEFIWNMDNGLVMASTLWKQFDKGDFVLMPITAEHGKPSRWRFVLMNEKLRAHGISSRAGYKKYRDLDGTELEFKNDNRPAHRFLYYHFVSTLLRYIRCEKPGWAGKMINLPTGKIWATPGPYLRKSMLKTIANAIGDYEPSKELLNGGVLDGEDSGSPGEGGLMAQGVLVEREERAEG
ncbi:MAG: hypothetical protein M1813_003900 [Trichoglossum hirsutum]|nr:MAG: hypothetical protein M1813_003900 [Trichoglossum hirsutum]